MKTSFSFVLALVASACLTAVIVQSSRSVLVSRSQSQKDLDSYFNGLDDGDSESSHHAWHGIDADTQKYIENKRNAMRQSGGSFTNPSKSGKFVPVKDEWTSTAARALMMDPAKVQTLFSRKDSQKDLDSFFNGLDGSDSQSHHAWHGIDSQTQNYIENKRKAMRESGGSFTSSNKKGKFVPTRNEWNSDAARMQVAAFVSDKVTHQKPVQKKQELSMADLAKMQAEAQSHYKVYKAEKDAKKEADIQMAKDVQDAAAARYRRHQAAAKWAAIDASFLPAAARAAPAAIPDNY